MSKSWTRREFVTAAAAAGLACALPSLAFAQTGESALARIKRTGVLRTGFVAGAAPYYTKSVATGQWQGFCVDFANSLAAFLGARLQVVETTWGNSVLDLQANKIDCMFGLAPTPQREKMVGFSQPLFQNTFTLVARQGFAPKSWADVDRPGVKLSVDIGSNQDTFATQNLKQATLRRFDTSGDATLALQTGQVDAQVLVVLLAATVLSKAPSLGRLIVPTPPSSAPTAIGVQKEADPALLLQINAWLAKTRASGDVRKTILNNMQTLAHIDPTAFPKEVTF
ncbi:MAG: transporter substrate-binding domain-containing protein [Janthinobacterium lividum]